MASQRERPKEYFAEYRKANRQRCSAYNQKYRDKNREKLRLRQREYRKQKQDHCRQVSRNNALLRKYGITSAEFDRMVKSQNGKCLICDRTPKRFFVDHCHSTGKVRGLLCSSCNVAIGLIREDIMTWHRMANYLWTTWYRSDNVPKLFKESEAA